MMKLFCAVVGVTGSTFPVNIASDETVGDLKEAIEAKKMYSFPADELRLFLANTSTKNSGEKERRGKDIEKGNAWLSSKSAAALELEEGIVGQDIQTWIAGKAMDPTLSIQDVLDKNHMPTPQNGQIHVLIVPPAVSTSYDTLTPTSLREEIDKAVNDFYEPNERPVYSISTCSSSKAEKLVDRLGYENDVVPVVDEIDRSIDPYQWQMDIAEDAEDQRNGYIQYLKANLHGVVDQSENASFSPGTLQRKSMFYLEDTSQMKNLLYCDSSCLPFGLNGTADLMIISEVAHRMGDVFGGLHCVIEIKKNPGEATERRKLFLKLVLADLKSDVASAPIGLLTNLNDYWYFMWFTTDRKIMRMKLSCPANGFKAMKDFLTETFDVIKKESPGRQTGIYPMRFLSSPLPKRQKLIQPAPTAAIAAAEMMERYELMADVLPPEFLREKRMEFHLLMLREAPSFSGIW